MAAKAGCHLAEDGVEPQQRTAEHRHLPNFAARLRWRAGLVGGRQCRAGHEEVPKQVRYGRHGVLCDELVQARQALLHVCGGGRALDHIGAPLGIALPLDGQRQQHGGGRGAPKAADVVHQALHRRPFTFHQMQVVPISQCQQTGQAVALCKRPSRLDQVAQGLWLRSIRWNLAVVAHQVERVLCHGCEVFLRNSSPRLWVPKAHAGHKAC